MKPTIEEWLKPLLAADRQPEESAVAAFRAAGDEIAQKARALPVEEQSELLRAIHDAMAANPDESTPGQPRDWNPLRTLRGIVICALEIGYRTSPAEEELRRDVRAALTLRNGSIEDYADLGLRELS